MLIIAFSYSILLSQMAKKKNLSYKEKMAKALESLPSPLEDKKHRIFIVFENSRARSNETRFEHIIHERHELKPSDIRRILHKINTSSLKKDQERKDTYNLYTERNNYGKEYIKISMELNFKRSNITTVKTIFITTNLK